MSTNVEHLHTTRSLSLKLAEELPPFEVGDLSGFQNRATWGTLERALADQDCEQLVLAIEEFKRRLTGEENSVKCMEHAVIIAMSEMYEQRVQRLDPSLKLMTSTAGAINTLRTQILDPVPGSKDESYDFELQVLEELLNHGISAYMASPREEQSQYSAYNHDLYILSGTKKVPISVKIGGKSTSKYAGGVRCISKKRVASDAGVWAHLLKQIPELASFGAIAR